MKSHSHLNTGITGEQLAADYLRQKGFEIVATNYRFGKAEVDIIAFFEGFLVGIEVKTRSNSIHGEPAEFISSRKWQLLSEALENFAIALDFNGDIRFDVVSITFDTSSPSIMHYPDVSNGMDEFE